jgi:hypothetical protein
MTMGSLFSHMEDIRLSIIYTRVRYTDTRPTYCAEASITNSNPYEKTSFFRTLYDFFVISVVQLNECELVDMSTS